VQTSNLPPEPPGPASEDAYDSTDIGVSADNPLALLMSLGQTYGDIVRCPNRYGQSYLYNRPDLVRHVLHSANYERTQLLKMALGESTLSADGAIWKRQRRIVNPAFLPARVRNFSALMVEEAEVMTQRWLREGTDKVDIDEEMMRLTLTIVVRALFSTDVSEDVHQISDALTAVIKDLGALTSTLFSVPVSFDPGRNRRMKAALDTLDRIVFRIIEARRSQAQPRGDLLDMLLNAEDPETGERLSDERLRDEAVTMLVAGHETTATSLTWAWSLLSDNPEAEARFSAEIDALGEQAPTAENMNQMPWVQGVLQESLRLYPPVWAIARKVKEDETLAGHHIKGNSAAFICPYMLHRHPDYWPEPERFDPSRFDDTRGPKIERYAYVPFARGPHMCAGHHFATQEGVLILATVGKHFQLRRLRQTPPEPWPLVTLRVKDGLPMKLLPRSGA